MRRTAVSAVAVVLLLCLVVVIGGLVWQRMHEPYQGYQGAEQFVEIPSGSNATAIGRLLIEAGVIRDEGAFQAAIWWTGRSRVLQAGEYRFDRPLAPLDVVDRVARGDVYTRRITFPEGLTIPEMARIYEAAGFGAAASFMEAARDPSPIRDLDRDASDLEGYLFPETYALPRGTAARRLVELMVTHFRAACSDEWQRLAERQGLTTRQLVTLASLVEKETAKPDERPVVAAVYRNRLRIGMPLQADPTVVYALQRAGKYDGNIRRQDLAFDSPYNTYRYPGLPPGPIAAPGKASIEAALEPARVSYLYFVSRNDGSHVFATSLADHNRNVRRFQILYVRR